MSKMVQLHASEKSTERRSHARQRMVLRVGLLTASDRTTFCLVKNISPTGVQVKLYGRIGAGAEITLHLGDEQPVAGRIAWAEGGLAGIEFAAPLAASSLLRATQRLPPARRRSSPRASVAAKLLIRTGGRSYPAELRDISATGAKVQTGKPVQLGPSVMLAIPGLPPLRSYVRWQEHTDLGLSFETPLAIELIARWLEERLTASG